MHINNPFSSHSSDPLEQAKSLLVHYFQVASGKTFDDDSVSEVASIIDSISEAIEFAQPENKIKKLERQVAILNNRSREQNQWLERISDSLNKLDGLEGANLEIIEDLKSEFSDYFAD